MLPILVLPGVQQNERASFSKQPHFDQGRKAVSLLLPLSIFLWPLSIFLLPLSIFLLPDPKLRQFFAQVQPKLHRTRKT
jgi:hypothetical protein